jgi:cell division protein FtsB
MIALLVTVLCGALILITALLVVHARAQVGATDSQERSPVHDQLHAQTAGLATTRDVLAAELDRLRDVRVQAEEAALRAEVVVRQRVGYVHRRRTDPPRESRPSC